MSIIMNGVTLNGGDRSVILACEIKYVWLCLGVLVNMSEYDFFCLFSLLIEIYIY